MKQDILKVSSIGHEEKKSKVSLRLAEIKGFTYGGVNSRFWKMRKYINNLDRGELEKIPFYSWECLTIETIHRSIDFVIRDQLQMNMLLKFLIYELKTIDGSKDSALEYINPKQSFQSF